MNEVPAAECDADMRRPLAHGFEEHQIAGLDVVGSYALPSGVLLPRLSWQGGAVFGEDPLHEAAAIEPA